MLECEFEVPERPADLLSSITSDYVVKTRHSLSEIKDSVREFNTVFQEDSNAFIFNTFDVYYGIHKYFGDVPDTIRETAYEFLVRALNDIYKELSALFTEEENEEDQDTKFRLRNAVKMILYWLSILGNQFEKISYESTTGLPKKGPRKRITSVTSWDQKRNKMIQNTKKLFSLPLKRLFESAMSRKLVQLLLKFFFKAMENPSFAKDSKATDDVFLFLAHQLELNDSQLMADVSKMIVQLIKEQSHLPSVFAQAVSVFVKQHKLQEFPNAIFNQIVSVDYNDTSSNTTKLQNLCQFVTEIAEKCPTETIDELDVLMEFSHEESHIMRNCLILIMREILLHISQLEDVTQEQEAVRGRLSEYLLTQRRDGNSFVRSKCLQVIRDLVEKQAIPVSQLTKFLNCAIDRILDKTIAVRKSAIQVLKASLQPSYFALKFTSNYLQGMKEKGRKNLEELKTKYEAMCEDADKESLQKEMTMKTIYVEYCERSIEFLKLMSGVVPTLCQLLYSSNSFEVIEIVEFFGMAEDLKCEFSQPGIFEMLQLMTSSEANVRAAVMECYKNMIFVNGQSPDKSIDRLLDIIVQSGVSQAKRIQEMVQEFIKSNVIKKNMKNYIWDKFTNENTTHQHRVAAVILLTFISSEDPEMMISRFDEVVKVGLDNELAKKDSRYASEVCNALLSTAERPEKNISVSKPFRLPQTHDLFTILTTLLTDGLTNPKLSGYLQFGKKALEVFFVLGDSPPLISKVVLRKMLKIYSHMIPQDSQAELNLKHRLVYTRILSFVGDFAMMYGSYCDTHLFFEFKRRQFVKQGSKASIGAAQRRRSSLSVANKSNDEDMEQDQKDAEETFEADVIEFIEKGLLREELSPQNLIGALFNMVYETCKWQSQAPVKDIQLSGHATYALAKFMYLNANVCQHCLPMVEHFITDFPSEGIRSAMVIALGDLLNRFSHVIGPHLLFSRVKDESECVRKNAVIVITHLILHGTIKVKTELSDLVVCMADENKMISDTVKHLVYELSKRHNLLYNCTDDLVNGLTAMEDLPEEKFEMIMKFIIPFVDKEKYVEGLVLKICRLVKETSSDNQLLRVGFLLNLLHHHNLKSVRTLLNFKDAFMMRMDNQEFAYLVNDVVEYLKKNFSSMEEEINTFSANIQRCSQE